MAARRGSCSWDGDYPGCKRVVTLPPPEAQHVSGRTLEKGLFWYLVWLMAPVLGIGPFLL
jgi:hypothetical protein